jgi:anaerobic selenocysteine-containing dehydrogenase
MREVRRTACNRDCPDACSMLVTVEDGRAVRLQGDPDDPVTQGFLCERTSRFGERQYARDRFTTPRVRRGGRLEAIGWDAALDLAAERLLAIRKESGPAAILHYRSGGSLGILKTAADFLFERFGPVTTKRGDICSGAGEAANRADFGLSDSSDLFDLLDSRLIVLWGKNVHTSGPHLLPLLNEAKRRGARIVGLDPVRTKAASLCDLFLQPRPGADAAVAFAIARHLFIEGGVDPDVERYSRGLDEFRALVFARSFAEWCEEADVPIGDARRLADLYATVKPSTLLVGWGLARRRNGAATVRALDALGIVSGNVGVKGGSVSYTMARRAPFDFSFLTNEAPRTIAEPLLGDGILQARDPPIRAVWITAGNPVAMLPDSSRVRRALETRDFVVAVDTHPNDTTDVAHLVLPCLTLLEDDDVLGSYGNHWMRRAQPAVAPAGEARHEIAILRGLAERLGLADQFPAGVDAWQRRVLARVAPHGITPESLARAPARHPFAPKVLFEGRRFATSDGKASLMSAAPRPPPKDESYPLLLMAVSTPKAQSSQWAVDLGDAVAEVRVHPSAAAGFADGALARLESRLGSLRVVVRHDEAVRPDVAWMAKGGARRDGRCANDLIRAELTDDGEGASYYDEPVRLAPAS